MYHFIHLNINSCVPNMYDIIMAPQQSNKSKNYIKHLQVSAGNSSSAERSRQHEKPSV